MATFQALLFDLGKVVFDLSFDRVFRAWSAASGVAYEQLKSQFQFDGIFDEFEKAQVTPTKFRTQISRQLGFALSDDAFDAGWCALYLDPYRGIEDLLAELAQRYTLVALTNTNSIHSEVWRVKYAAILSHFQRVFSSHELQTRKPEARAYQLVLDYLQLAPEQVVFLDDNSQNIEGARQLGLATILVTSYQQMKADILALGLLS